MSSSTKQSAIDEYILNAWKNVTLEEHSSSLAVPAGWVLDHGVQVHHVPHLHRQVGCRRQGQGLEARQENYQETSEHLLPLQV